jgi:tetratricopeptide (TPR) repeat protein
MLLTCLALLGLGAMVYFIMNFATDRIGLPMVYWFVPVFGAIGGAVGGILRNGNTIALCRLETPVKIEAKRKIKTADVIFLGVTGDIAVGLGGACAVVFLFGSAIRIDPDPKETMSKGLLISISFLAGAFGKNIIATAGEKLLAQARAVAKEEAEAAAAEKVEERVAPTAATAYATSAAHKLMFSNEDEYHEALKLAGLALQNEPGLSYASLVKGVALKRLGRVEEALAAVEEGLKIHPGDARLRYNRACYLALLNKDSGEIWTDLQQACEASPEFCEEARLDSDLERLRTLPQFREAMLTIIEEALRSRRDNTPVNALLHYSKACYMVLLKRDTEEILAELKKAFAADQRLVKRAQADRDLEPLRGLPQFKKLLSPNA